MGPNILTDLTINLLRLISLSTHFEYIIKKKVITFNKICTLYLFSSFWGDISVSRAYVHFFPEDVKTENPKIFSSNTGQNQGP
jgi:hypothetical protein